MNCASHFITLYYFKSVDNYLLQLSFVHYTFLNTITLYLFKYALQIQIVDTHHK